MIRLNMYTDYSVQDIDLYFSETVISISISYISGMVDI